MTERSSSLPRAPAPLRVITKHSAPLRQQVVDELRAAIIGGRLDPGARLVERELIAMLGVSRTVIREAMRQLESEGLLAASSKGLVVRTLTVDEAEDLYSIRAVLEGLAARLFVENGNPSQRAALGDAVRSTAEAYGGGDPERVLAAKNRFYEILFAGAASETLSTMIAALHARIWRWRALGLGHPQRSARRSRESLSFLRALHAAIERGDAEAAERLAREDVTKAAAEVLRLLGEARTEESPSTS